MNERTTAKEEAREFHRNNKIHAKKVLHEIKNFQLGYANKSYDESRNAAMVHAEKMIEETDSFNYDEKISEDGDM